MDNKFLEEQTHLYNEILKADSFRSLNEATMNRVIHRFRHSGASSFAIITYATGHRYEPFEVDESIGRRFTERIRERKFDFISLTGHLWKGRLGRDGNIAVRIPVYVILGITLAESTDMMKDFNQQGFVYQGPETDNTLWLVSHSGMEEEDDYTPMNAANYLGLVFGLNLIFEGLPDEYVDENLVDHSVRVKNIRGFIRKQECGEY